jgi:hypothetical protein
VLGFFDLVTRDSGIVLEDGTTLMVSDMLREQDLVFATNQDIKDTVIRLAARKQTDSAGMFALRQQACGFKHEPNSMLLDKHLDDVLKPASQFAFDWMHLSVVHGVFNTVLYLLLEDLIDSGMPNVYSQLHSYMLEWRFPSSVATSPVTMSKLLTSKSRIANKKAKHFRCSASQALGFYPIVALFLLRAVLPASICTEGISAFLAMSDMIDMLQKIPLGQVTSDMLRASINKFIDHCVSSGWATWLHPKFHWLVHLPNQLDRFGCLPSCWVHERKHKMVKRYCIYIYIYISITK